jgi:hypothetical protein
MNNNSSRLVNNNNNTQSFLSQYFVWILLALSLATIGYVIYYYAQTDTALQGQTYYSEDILHPDHIFNSKADNLTQCIDQCKLDTRCDGITYDSETGQCLGQGKGRLRNDNENYYAWVKPPSQSKKIDVVETLVSSVQPNKEHTVPAEIIPYPPFPNRFSISFWIEINDFYHNFGYWRNVFHRGQAHDQKMRYKTWEQVIKDLPLQTPGLWMTPYQNNLRIVYTTEQTLKGGFTKERPSEHAQTPEEKQFLVADEVRSNLPDQQVRYMEYSDLGEIPVGKSVFLCLIFHDKSIEYYLDGKLRKTFIMDGSPVIPSGELFIKQIESYDGYLDDLKYHIDAIPYNKIQEIYRQGNPSLASR